MLKIDQALISQMLKLSDSSVTVLLITSLCCCGALLMIMSFSLPYFYGIETLNYKTNAFVIRVSPETVAETL